MTRYILTIAGEGSRWGNYLGVRKHLVPINGEPNLHRTIRLIKENDKTAEICLGINPAFPPDGLDHTIITYDGTSYVKGAESDRYFASIPYWNLFGRTVLIWGDVFFTEAAIKTLCADHSNWIRYARDGACSYSKRKHWGEEFAFSFHPYHHDDLISACKRVERISERYGKQLFGAIYLAMLGINDSEIFAISGTGRKPNMGHQIDINDLTDDFDFPADYDEFIAIYKGE